MRKGGYHNASPRFFLSVRGTIIFWPNFQHRHERRRAHMYTHCGQTMGERMRCAMPTQMLARVKESTR
jgi:hypothetical protein